MSLLDLVFPKKCLDCGKEGKYICSDCISKVCLAKQICPVCQKASIDGLTHAKCQTKYGLDGLTSIWEYEGVVRKAILALKFKYSTEVGNELTNLFARYFQDSRFLLPDSAFLVPVPMHWYGENLRGFNQADLIGKKIAENFGWKYYPGLLVKKKSTVSQVELSGDKRRQNLKGVFSLDSRFEIPDSVLLFDDVFTTGSTLKESAKVLKRAGVQKVWGLTIAR